MNFTVMFLCIPLVKFFGTIFPYYNHRDCQKSFQVFLLKLSDCFLMFEFKIIQSIKSRNPSSLIKLDISR